MKQNKIKNVIHLPDDMSFEDNSYVIVLSETSLAFIVNQNKKAKYIGFTLPKDIFDKYKTILKYNLSIYLKLSYSSKYIEQLVQNTIISDNKIYIVYAFEPWHQEYVQILLYALKYLDKNNKRIIENCYDDYIGFYDNPILSVTICEYNKYGK